MKRCRVCKKKFEPFNSLQVVCSPQCGLEYFRTRAGSNFVKKEKRKQTKKDKEKLKTLGDYKEETQTACNTYIRTRDEGNNCISCGRPPKKKNAGHYRSVGAAPELRYHPMNIHLQCEHCNSWKSGNQIKYRINLIQKIGVENVEWLEGPHKAQHLTKDDLIEIKEYYREQTKRIGE